MELNYEEKCRCSEDIFCRYIDNSDKFSAEDKKYIQRKILHKKVTGVLYVSSMLVGWSVVGAWIDAVLFPGAALATILSGEFEWMYVAPAIVFSIVNYMLKFSYVYLSLRGKVPLLSAMIAVLPYVGSAFLVKPYLLDEPKLRRAVMLFLAYQKDQFVHPVKKRVLRWIGR
ncbi:MAG: hypothetical protein MI784_04255 [Cytophagales bacterium]|nr:hypothetical protein [Cytophagales bacterium]